MPGYHRTVGIAVPKIAKLDRNYLKLHVPSRTVEEARTVQYFPSGKHHCDCKGHYWFMKGGRYDELCRHCQMTTMRAPGRGAPLRRLGDAWDMLTNKRIKIEHVWNMFSCLQYDHYDRQAVHCKSCAMYPDVCNIHPIKTGKRNTSKPLVWKLQTTILHGRRKDAKKLLRKIHRIAKERL